LPFDLASQPKKIFFLEFLKRMHHCFFCAAGPISLSNAPYETCKLPIAAIPTLRIATRMSPVRRPMKSPARRLVMGNDQYGGIVGTRCQELILLEQRPKIVINGPFGSAWFKIPLQVQMFQVLEGRLVDKPFGVVGGCAWRCGEVDNCIMVAFD
jgi:hypothetical protein